MLSSFFVIVTSMLHNLDRPNFIIITTTAAAITFIVIIMGINSYFINKDFNFNCYYTFIIGFIKIVIVTKFKHHPFRIN